MRDRFDGWARSSHHAFTVCNGCHSPHVPVGQYVTKAGDGFWHSKAFTFQDFEDPIRIRARNSRILRDACVRCHEGLERFPR